MLPKFAAKSSKAVPIHVIQSASLEKKLKALGKGCSNWAKKNGFKAMLGQVLTCPDKEGNIESVLLGWGSENDRRRGSLHAALAPKQLPKGVYEFASGLTGRNLEQAHLAWLLAGYKFDRYKKSSPSQARLKPSKGIDTKNLLTIVEGDFLTRDLINTPTNDMGPDDLQMAFVALAKKHGAKTKIIKGADLLKRNFPLIHTVGRASAQAPRLLELNWGKKNHPKLCLVGKGVCFDTGGLNIKPASSMGLMKKDMGGAATVIGLAHMIMAQNLPVNLRVLVPAVENSISSNSYRPQDVIKSRKGLSIEINNTDAEGRLVLADALALADEDKPDLLICNATLTGAARVALGPDVPPFYTDDDQLASQISKSSETSADPAWRMPFWDGYESMVEPKIADLDNAPKGGFAGSITAALFLRRFVENTNSFVHFDLYGWSPNERPGVTQGGACQSARLMLDVIKKRYG